VELHFHFYVVQHNNVSFTMPRIWYVAGSELDQNLPSSARYIGFLYVRENACTVLRSKSR